MREPTSPPIAVVEGFPAPRGPLCFTVKAGELILLRGANGSGKTSLLRALAGLDGPLVPERVQVLGRDPRNQSAARLAGALATQDPRDGLVGLTVEGEFRLRGQAQPGEPPVPGVPEEVAALRDRPVASLSSGEARRVALAAAQAARRPLLLLDEPDEGLDDEGCSQLRRLVQQQLHHGAVVAADHEGVLEDLATRVVDLHAPVGPSPELAGKAGAGADGRATTASPDFQATTPGPSAAPAPASILRCPAGWLARAPGAAGIRLPAVDLGAGFHVVRGPNGSGKSTLLLHVAGLLDTTTATIQGATPTLGVNVRLLLPRARDLLSRDSVAAELGAGRPDGAAEAFVAHLDRARHPLSLSGGEAQRLALAKCLGTPAPAYLLDEPEAHLDAAGRRTLQAVLAARVAQGACILAATHDPVLGARAASTLLLAKGTDPHVTAGGPG